MNRGRKVLMALPVAVVTYLSAMILSVEVGEASQPSMAHQWYAFTLWHVSLMATTAFALDRPTRQSVFGLWSHLQRADAKLLGLLFLFCVATQAYRMEDFPFAMIGDAIRDAGLEARRINEGTIPVFSWGPYLGQTRLIAAYNSFFHSLAGNSLTTIRIHSCAIATVECGLFYVLLRLFFSSSLSFFGGLLLAATPLHQFFARSETVIAYNSFWSTVFLGLFCITWRLKLPRLAILTALVLGFGLNFHAAMRPVAALGMLGVAWLTYPAFKAAPAREKWMLVLATAGAFYVGFGPMLLFSAPSDLFTPQKLEGVATSTWDLMQRYFYSIGVFISTPNSFHYGDRSPIFDFAAALLLILGLTITASSDRRAPFLFALAGLILLPLTNSAMTESLNKANRITVYLPPAVLLMTLGTEKLCQIFGASRLPIPTRMFPLGLFWISITGGKLWDYFDREPGSYASVLDPKRMHEDYLLAHTRRLIQSSQELRREKQACISGNSHTLSPMQKLHVTEYFSYFLPHVAISVQENSLLADGTVLIAKTCGTQIGEAQSISLCREHDKFVCPPDGTTLHVLVDRNVDFASADGQINGALVH